ncbi:MAG: MCE family protein [Candidatus Zixiibacteriota bacterium]|nr:MAG: MCE family protein [candidate division Zixibacteria bacterium]
MKNISVELRVGLVVIVAALILFFGIIWIKDYSLGLKRREYQALFPNIGSLATGDPVRVLGVKKGETVKIDLSGNEVLVTFTLTEDVNLRNDALITVKNLGLMGERFIDIDPGSSDISFDRSKPVQGYYDTGISEVMGMMGRIIVEMRQLISVFEEALDAEEGGKSLKNIIKDTEKITNNLRRLTENNKDRINRGVDDFSEASSRLRRFVEKNEPRLDNITENLDESSKRLLDSGANIDSISIALKELMRNLENGEGTLGRAMKDEMLYEKLLKTTSNLDSLITDLRENPKKYIHFSIF